MKACSFCAGPHRDIDCPLARRALLESWQVHTVKIVPHRDWWKVHK